MSIDRNSLKLLTLHTAQPWEVADAVHVIRTGQVRLPQVVGGGRLLVPPPAHWAVGDEAAYVVQY